MCDLCVRVNKAFHNLSTTKGYFAEGNWKCCQPCGIDAIPEESDHKYVFYHAQEAERMKDKSQGYLHWAGDGKVICEALRGEGVAVQWNGDDDEAIRVGSRN